MDFQVLAVACFVDLVSTIKKRKEKKNLSKRYLRVMKVDVRHCDKVGTVRNVQQTIQVILAGVEVSLEVAVVDPDVGGGVDADGVAVAGLDARDLHVADDDVLGLADVQTDAGQRAAALAIDGLVGRDADLGAALDVARHDDGQGSRPACRLGQGRQGLDGHGAAACASAGSAVLRAVADVAGLVGLALDQLLARLQRRGGDEADEQGESVELHVYGSARAGVGAKRRKEWQRLSGAEH